MTEAGIVGFMLVFCRVGGVMFLLPGFGEQSIPMRVRLAVTFAFALVIWPMLVGGLADPQFDNPLYLMIATEAIIGLMLGISIRFMVWALQYAGSVAGQATSLAQIFGSNNMDPMPVIGNILMLGGITLAVVGGLHVKAAMAMAQSYEILPIGQGLPAEDVVTWGTAKFADAFALGFSLAAPFVLAAFAYNISLGAISRAMPQLMVALIGAPAIIGATILIFFLSAPVILTYWNGKMDLVLSEPLATPR
ncbi:flagellar biosynthetic protein FliR [Amaricoccus tamworthensis]|uniref:flagellar biosynthetic protein FliR n=1 Tax=Amaricoccus tamworthensis TaxID=57002 RepID=UPI003C7AF988